MNGTWLGLASLQPTELINIAAYSLVILFGLVGNLWVTWKVGLVLLFSRPHLGAVSAAQTGPPKSIVRCIVVICVADLVVLSTLCLLVDNLIHGYWRFGHGICKIFYGVEVLNKFVIPLTLVQISRMTHAAVMSASSPKDSGSSRPLLLINLFTIITFLLLLACVLAFSSVISLEMGGGRHRSVCTFAPPLVYGLLFNGAAFFVGYVLSVLYVYFYISVPVILKRRSSQSSQRAALMRLNNSAIGRIRRTVISFVLIYLFCWTPYWIVFWLSSLVYFPRWLVMMSLFAHVLPYASCAAYPVMLTCMNDGIHSAHSTVISSKKRQLSTIRAGVVQVLSQMTAFQSVAVAEGASVSTGGSAVLV